ncbi:MAG: monovalent cation:proton antiporter-2 (CPA2) family protein [Bacteriovoracaceae bacterium]|nr:monovalent cation:proton antiporter-2 (CPA2) family protein [Bacteriovoracaceae bacterium]
MEDHQYLLGFIIFLTATLIFVPLTKKLGLGAILGYLMAGLLIGPSILGFFNDVHRILAISEFGVVLFMFLIGLELRPEKLRELRTKMLWLGAPQMLLSVMLGFFLLQLMSHGNSFAFALSMALTLSSTAIGLQVMQERKMAETNAGKGSFAILLFQDLAIIPMLLVVSFLGASHKGSIDHLIDYKSLLRIFMTVAFIIFLGKYFLNYIFRQLAATQLRELFTSISLLLVVGVSLLMESVGLSMAFGSFLAGLLLAESEYRFELETSIEPFKGLLMGLFFTSVGMTIDLSLIINKYEQVFIYGVAAFLFKFGLHFLIGKISGMDKEESTVMALITAPIGEFAFVILKLSHDQSLITQSQLSLCNLVIVSTMVFNPLSLLLYDRVFKKKFNAKKNKSGEKNRLDEQKENPVIVAGFGRLGTVIVRLLHAKKINATVLDTDPKQIEQVKKIGFKAYFGDATRLDMLKLAGAENAKVLLIVVDDTFTAEQIVRLVRVNFPHLKIMARCHGRNDYYALREAGADMIFRDAFLTGLTMGQKLLEILGERASDARKYVHRFKEHDEEMLEQAFFHHHNQEALISLAKRSFSDLDRILNKDEDWVRKEGHWND